ncbi:MAG TPA: DUF87 domain-containing protein [Acidimicrobiales bacterium]|nr:DUF87 domain-containing protein [Acidimicrobiales bacterium]
MLAGTDGEAVKAFLVGDVMAGAQRLSSRRHQLTIGTDDAGAAVRIPASGVNILVAGGTGAGKSYVLGLLAEQLVDSDYSALVIDRRPRVARRPPRVVGVGGRGAFRGPRRSWPCCGTASAAWSWTSP